MRLSVLLLLMTTGLASGAAPTPCDVSLPNADGWFSNDALRVQLWPDGTVVFKPRGPGSVLTDGSLSMKFPWERKREGQLRIDGRRLDAPAAPLRANIPCCYGEVGFQATTLIFATTGCWEVTGRVGDASLTFITRVVKIGDGPVRPEPR